MEIRGLSALVTGASRGLGAALVKELARRGARVAGVARGEAELANVVAEARAAGGEAHGRRRSRRWRAGHRVTVSTNRTGAVRPTIPLTPDRTPRHTSR